ncbi:DUF1684 domain-containing protein [Flavitalea sp. BT771]|uniref:DUF1684 domain-containing protein n=1 Tax=Flavitalea sp. BT771 TaxID=3063329 RepID=UPI0026E119F4|nr:DUF1684 domain-containing protein [Flavitalea sp. BT771]MDO6432843.1 DUF1684 domain-containing protein [Flavitalea sp. BT771]MDV6221881.1 DUF1684 domain-containing protein [Flavitalea sp. BT771]
MLRLYRLLLSIISLLWAGDLLAQTTVSYAREIEAWHVSRINSLRSADGWLNLAGLYWLEEGKNSFGSDPGNKIVFPKASIAGSAGYFERNGNTVKIVVQDNVDIKVNGIAVKEAVIYDKDPGRPPVVSHGSLRWTIIRRDDRIGVRLRDVESPLALGFKDIDRYPVDSTWRIVVTLRKETYPQTIAITNVLGQTSQQQTPGKLVFTIGGKQYSLDALEEGDHLFIIFADATSGKTTYPSGRFLYVNKPDADGATFIDFNKAFNPPCAFTPYATCPLPPNQNVLDLEITAGEKDYGHH